MPTALAVPLMPLAPVPRSGPSACRYDCGRQPRSVIMIAACISASLHVAVLFGVGHTKKKVVTAGDDNVIALNLQFEEIKELDDPEPVVADDPGEKPDPGVLVPMLADFPQVPQPSDFVQQVDFASLVERPDLSTANLTVVPEHIGRGQKIGEGLGAVFNLADLDRAPTPVLQTAPIPPAYIKREGAVVTVRVEFIVTADGRVVNAYASSSTDARYEDAAAIGVSKWKFKPGMKAGRKVNTRMAVPILFKPLPAET
ncbi:MAG: energy transducer TonB [Opitutus sp.]